MNDLPTFLFFPDPLREGVFETSHERCDVCRRQRGWLYNGPAYGEHDDKPSLCPWCIADGSAAATFGVSFHDRLRRIEDGAGCRISDTDRTTLMERTPGYLSWQGNEWVVCCGRPCVYLGEADRGDLTGRWAAALPSMFAETDWPADEITEFARDYFKGGSHGAYVFQCLNCGQLGGYWDCD